MRRVTSLVSLLIIGTGCAMSLPPGHIAAAEGADDPSAPSASVWMKKKLDYTQEILAGIALSDFDRVEAAAEQLKTLNKVEAFVRARNPAYREQLKAFQNANEEILRQAAAKNVDGAAAALSQMTTSCIRCHKVLRDRPAD